MKRQSFVFALPTVMLERGLFGECYHLDLPVSRRYPEDKVREMAGAIQSIRRGLQRFLTKLVALNRLTRGTGNDLDHAEGLAVVQAANDVMVAFQDVAHTSEMHSHWLLIELADYADWLEMVAEECGSRAGSQRARLEMAVWLRRQVRLHRKFAEELSEVFEDLRSLARDLETQTGSWYQASCVQRELDSFRGEGNGQRGVLDEMTGAVRAARGLRQALYHLPRDIRTTSIGPRDAQHDAAATIGSSSHQGTQTSQAFCSE